MKFLPGIVKASSAIQLLNNSGGQGTNPYDGRVREEPSLEENATLTNAIITGTSTSGPMTAASAAPESMPNTETATAIANSKLFEAAVNASVAVFE